MDTQREQIELSNNTRAILTGIIAHAVAILERGTIDADHYKPSARNAESADADFANVQQVLREFDRGWRSNSTD